MRCAHCEAEFTPKNTRGRFCSSRCRSAAWQASRTATLAGVQTTLERVLVQLRSMQRER